jgi:c-di-GMP-related signal transduction protein
MSTITTHTENIIIMSVYVPRQSILNKNLLSYELLLRNSLENRHVSAAPANIDVTQTEAALRVCKC